MRYFAAVQIILFLILSPVAHAEPQLIDSIIINNRNIFPTDSSKYNRWYFRLANTLHIKTRKYVVSRELLQKKGDVFSRELADEAERNLRSTLFLWDAKIDYFSSPEGKGIMRVTTSDRWTLAGGPSFSRVGGDNIIELRAEESNLLGTGQYILFDYFHHHIEPDYLQLSYLERRLLGTRNQFNIYVNTDPLIGAQDFSIQKPFYSLGSKFAYSILYSKVDRRTDYYSAQEKIAENKVGGEVYQIGSTYRWGDLHNKIFAGLSYQYRNLNYSAFKGGGVTFPSDSSYNVFFATFGLQNLQYASTHRINYFRQTEDITLASGGTVIAGWHYDNAWSQIYRSISFLYSYDHSWNNDFIFLGLNRSYWYKGNVDFRNQLNISIKYYDNRFKWMTTVLQARYQEDHSKNQLFFLQLGEDTGIRGYPKKYASGEKLFLANGELRFFPGISILSIDLGAVQFVDVGEAASRGEKLTMNTALWSVGAGLRIGTGKASHHNIIRVDMAYAIRLRKWGVSLAAGQYLN